MAVILHDLPFRDQPCKLQVQGREHAILANQIIVWVSLSPESFRTIDQGIPRFPAVLDPGFTDTFLIHAEHLRRFAGLQSRHLVPLNRTMRAPGRQIPLHAANLWMHRNKVGERDRFRGDPFLLDLHGGIGICGDPDVYPRLPLLGARALRQYELHLTIDYQKCRVSMRTPRRFWFFG